MLTDTSSKGFILPDVKPNESLAAIERAITFTVAYADVFDYPLTVREIHRYLIGEHTSLETISHVLRTGRHISSLLSYQQGYFSLRGREEIVVTRQRRANIAAKLWPKAHIYGKLIALLPFTRMVAVTGALAVDNTDRNADIDFMIVTETGRLWLCRALVILLVRWASLHSDTVCPNLFVAEHALVYHQQDLYTAHEMAQMIPVAGYNIYRYMMALNAWTLDFLPNSQDNNEAHKEPQINSIMPHLRNSAEKFLRAPWIDQLERWEMTRKIRKFKRMKNWSGEANFSANWCRGYFNAHEQYTLLAYSKRVNAIEAAWRF
jgi:hypothetical protein